MFGKKRRELEEKLHLECEAHERDLQELNALRAGLELKERTLVEMQSAFEQRIQEMDEKSRLFAEERAVLIGELQTEIKQKRAALDEEIAKDRVCAEMQLNGKLEAFSNNYNYYLSQLKLIMDILTKASMTAGKSFLYQDEEDTAKLFQSIFNSELEERVVLQLPQQSRPHSTTDNTPQGAPQAAAESAADNTAKAAPDSAPKAAAEQTPNTGADFAGEVPG